MKILNIIGAGRVGRTLAALWRQQAVFEIQCVLNRTLASASDAVKFIGAGRAVGDLREIPPADLWLLATPDSELVHAAENLAVSGLLRAGDLVFHCSGALASSEIQAVAVRGAHVASVHPLKSFADPQAALRTFGGAQRTYCTAEGEVAALAVLKPAFEKIGARVMEIDPRYKTIYHAASVMVCNDLTALMEAGLQCYEKAGLQRETASMMMEPLVRETVENIFRLGTVQALTGPVARGDHAVVTRQLEALGEFDPRIAEIYRALGVMALALSRLQGTASEAALAALERVLRHAPKLQDSNKA